VKYANAAAFRMALEQRLLNLTGETDLSLARLRKTVVFDRLLVRLFASAPDRWVLKGALALDFRLESAGRATKDIDLLRRDNEGAAVEDLIAAQATELDDYFVFAIEKLDRREEWQEGAALRYRATAELAGRLFDEVIIDIGFSDPLQWEPERVRGPDIPQIRRHRAHRSARASTRAAGRGEASRLHARVRKRALQQPGEGPGRSRTDQVLRNA